MGAIRGEIDERPDAQDSAGTAHGLEPRLQLCGGLPMVNNGTSRACQRRGVWLPIARSHLLSNLVQGSCPLRAWDITYRH